MCSGYWQPMRRGPGPGRTPRRRATPDAKPGKPAAPTVTVQSATSLQVRWTAPVNPGSVITGYTLEQRADGGTDWSPVSGVSGTSHDVTGLTPGTAYVFRVLATNAAGDGAWSDSSSPATPSAAPAAPAAPAIPTLRPGDRQLEVSWHAPGSDGGSTITGYNIQYPRRRERRLDPPRRH